MENRRFRSRSESPRQRTQIGEPFVSCREWVERVNKVVTGVRGQIEAYEALWKYYSTFPPTYLIQGLLKAVAELEGPEKKPDSPIEKGRTEDESQKVDEQVIEEERAEQENNTENRMDKNQVKDLLNQISQQVNSNTRVPTKHQRSRNLHKTTQRMMINDSRANTLLVKIPLRKVKQTTGFKSKSKLAQVQIKADSRKTSVCLRCGRGDGRKENEKAKQMKDNLNKNKHQVNHNIRISTKHQSSKNTRGQATSVRSKSETAEVQVKIGNRKTAPSSNSSSSSSSSSYSSSGARENEKARRKKVNVDMEEKEEAGQVKKVEEDQMEVDSHEISQQLNNDTRVSNNHQRSRNTTSNNMGQVTGVTSKSKTEELKATLSRRSAGLDSSCGSSTVPKRARISMETAIDSASSSSSVMKNVSEPSFCIKSEPSCSTNSTSGVSSSSPSAKPTTLQGALRAKENPVQGASAEPRMSDGHDNKSEPNSGKNSESPQPAKRMRTNGNEVEDNNASTSTSSLSEADRISSNNGTTESVKVKMEIVNADVEEQEKAGQDKSLEEYQMKDESSQINQQVDNNSMEHHDSRNVTDVRSQSKTTEIQTAAIKVSAAPNSNGGGSTLEKGAHVHMKTVIDSACSVSSVTKNNSKPSCSTSSSCRSNSRSSSLSQRASTNILQVTLPAEKNPIQVALSEPKVLQNIFKFLPYYDLQSCLLVDLPLWVSGAEYAISQRPVLNVTLRIKESTMVKTWQHKQTKFTCGKKISELWSRIENCEKGLEIRLDVFKVHWQTLNTFFTKFSNVISKLTLWYTMWRKVTPSELEEILCRLPNLNHLHLGSVRPKWKEEKMTFPHKNASSSSLLPKIKTISFDSSDSFYPELLISLFEITPNLENIFNFPPNCIPNSTTICDNDLLQLSKIRSVKFLNFSTRENEQKMADLAVVTNIEQGIKLKMADLRFKISSTDDPLDLWKSCRKSWYKILENSQNTLEHLIIEPLGLSDMLEYPEIKAVKKLCLFDAMKRRKQKRIRGLQFFGENFDAAKTFPNLAQVTLNRDRYSSVSLEQFLKQLQNVGRHSCFKGVNSLSLNISDLESFETLNQAARLFPNVTELLSNIHSRGVANNFSQFLQLWPKLHSLKMKIERTWGYSYFRLDSIFTGISEKKCTDLRSQKEKIDIDLPSCRKKFAISNMTDLKELVLIFDGWYETGQKVCPFFSHVAAFYGFDCLPDLKVTFAIPWDQQYKDEIREVLSPILEYVNFNPDYAEPLDFYEKNLL